MCPVVATPAVRSPLARAAGRVFASLAQSRALRVDILAPVPVYVGSLPAQEARFGLQTDRSRLQAAALPLKRWLSSRPMMPVDRCDRVGAMVAEAIGPILQNSVKMSRFTM